MKIVKQNRIKNGYELETEEGYLIVASIEKGALGANWALTTDWNENVTSGLITIGSLGNIDPIESTKELIAGLKSLNVYYDPTSL